jgi:hypothetical protein
VDIAFSFVARLLMGVATMPIDPDLASSGVLMSTGIALIAVFLGLRQWYESRAREPNLSDLDRTYFFRQDLRRGLGVAIMLILALGIWIGASMEPLIAGKANLAFVQVWLVVSLLILVLLVLALLDWLATRLYARRLRQSIARERIDLLRQVFRNRKSASADGDPSSEPDQARD